MSQIAPAGDTATLLSETTEAQRRASDPTVSAWVAANAGAGKTHVLKMRVLRLLLAGVAPERILCLTYTKAAAAEMAGRVFADLSRWATAEEEILRKELAKLLGRSPSPDDLIAARQLFARAIETPGGLKVQTIHAFCERLLQRFPLEAGVPPGFSILDDETAATLRREAVNAALAEAGSEPDGLLGESVRRAVAYAADDRFDEVLRKALAERDWIEGLSRTEQRSGDPETFSLTRRRYLKAMGVAEDATVEDVTRQLADVLSPAELEQAARKLRGGSPKQDQRNAERLEQARRAATPEDRAGALEAVFLKADGEPRADSGLLTKALRESEPGLAELLADAKWRYADLCARRRNVAIVDATLALLAIADRVMQHYTQAKAERAALDFEDLIRRAAGLLGVASAAQWVLYKLDGGLDHVLVDEAQDTSPLQWTVIEQLVTEFFAGAGARSETEEELTRTIFAVGDEKQSIYSFQGAAPEMFAEAGARFAEGAVSSGQAFHRVPLTVSFRTVEPLLQAVDHVFANADRTPGLTASAAAVRHLALRQGQAGLVEVWPTEETEEPSPTPAFQPLDEPPVGSPITRLADRIAATIASWLATGERLVSQNRAIRPSDILILLRKRKPFAPEMVRALKRRGIAVAGADRIVLTEHIAVQDLMALADFLLLPEDDLALAVVLKSPLFGLDDDDLMSFAPYRKGALWSAFLAAARANERFEPAAEQLKKWRTQADFSPPFEFFSRVLDRDGGRRRMLARLGPEAADALDEFINLALTYDEQSPPSLQGFVSWLRDGRREIKRDMEHARDEVRVMTVHGSKGLEAPIVFLPDTCSAAAAGPPEPLAPLSPEHAFAPSALAWAISGSKGAEVVAASREMARAEARAEHNRLLYVAMTRARDRLYVAGFEGRQKKVSEDSWYATITSALDDQLQDAEDVFGNPVRRIETSQTADHEAGESTALGAVDVAQPPDWAERPAPREPTLTVPLAPSRVEVPEAEDDQDGAALSEMRDAAAPPMQPPAPSPLSLGRSGGLLRGNVTHALFQYLPEIVPVRREAAAERYIEAYAKELPPRARAGILREVMTILDDPDFAEAFGEGSRAEVPLVAEIPQPSGRGPVLQIAGQIDRLVVRQSDVLIVDFKTNRQAPKEPEGIAKAYLLQLAAYRLAVRQIFPQHDVKAALLWTEVPKLMLVPSDMLDRFETDIWSAHV